MTQIRDVDDTRYGWRVKGRIVVDGQRGYHRSRYDRYDRRYDRNYRGYGDQDRGKFTCYIERGRVAGVDVSMVRTQA